MSQQRYMTDPEFHARVTVAATWLADWDFRHGAGEDHDYYKERAIELVTAIESAATAGGFDPDWCVHPGATLREWREENGLGVQSAATTCGRMPVDLYEGIEAGSRKITKDGARALAHGTGISATLWLNLERLFRRGLAEGKTWTAEDAGERAGG